MDELLFNPVGLQGGATVVCDLAAELRTLRQTWWNTTQAPGDACGLQEVEDGYDQTRQVWSAELDVYIEILDEACRRLSVTGTVYGDAEADNTAAVTGTGA